MRPARVRQRGHDRNRYSLAPSHASERLDLMLARLEHGFHPAFIQ
jgi:hypothetical protein